MVKRIKLCLLLFALTGCACATTDPRQGGLFCYKREAYEQRLRERRQVLETLEKNTEEQRLLEREVEVKREMLAQQKRQLTTLDTDLADVQDRIATYHAQNQKQAAEKARLERDIRQARTRLQALKQEDGTGVDAAEEKQAKIQRLQADIEKMSKVLTLLLQSGQ
jgi:chromosome segregation ATPase